VKKILVVLGIVFLVILALAAVVMGWGYSVVWGSEGEAKSYVDRTVPRIVSAWDAKTLVTESAPELLTVAPPEKLQTLFAAFATRLGPLKQYNGATRERYFVNLNPWNRFVTFSYVIDASFENGSAKIRLGIIRRGGEWKITDFFVVSDALIPR
jgi:hypothetical protein